MKVFISQPMRGKSDEKILSERNQLIEAVKKTTTEEVEIIDSFIKEKTSPLSMLAESIKMLSRADVAVFARGWEEARGCRIEHECCVQYGIKIIEM